jgi:P-type Ca2+ transporter type 2C
VRIKLLALVVSSCNRACLPDIGDPTEIGLLEYAREKGVERLPIDEEEVPFTSENKYMKTNHGEMSFFKGAPEKIIGFIQDEEKKEILNKNEEMAKKGLRVLACAIEDKNIIRFVGLIAMEDPPRRTVTSAIVEAQKAGIRTIMITGDNVETAKTIARQVGITGDAMIGKELDSISIGDLQERVKTVSVFARVSPQHKVAILEALKQNGEIVSMSGDGVNDAPALKGAHVGIAMGRGKHRPC